MPQLDLNLFPSFLMVAECASISKAAQRLHITQPALSLQLKKLEDQIGQKVFDRHKSGLILTPFGEKLVFRSRELMRSAEAIVELNTEESGEPSGILTVATYASFASSFLPGIIAKFCADFPRVTVKIVYPSRDEIYKGILSYEIDLAVVTDFSSDNLIDAKKLFDDERFLFGTYKYPKQILPKDLATIPLLSYHAPADFCNQEILTLFGKYLKKNPGTVISDCFTSLKRLLLLGTGVAFMPSFLVSEELRAGKLQKIKVGQQKIPITTSVLRKKNACSRCAAEQFVTYLSSHAPEL